LWRCTRFVPITPLLCRQFTISTHRPIEKSSTDDLTQQLRRYLRLN